MKLKQKDKKTLIRWAIEFVKLQLAGNVLFWGTYLGFFLLYDIFNIQELTSLIIASLIAHGLFFIVDRNWVFADKTGRRKSSGEIVRFIIFMGINFFINIGIIQYLSVVHDITPYIGQFISAMFFVVWNFVGLKWWVFDVPDSEPKKGNDAKRRRTPTK